MTHDDRAGSVIRRSARQYVFGYGSLSERWKRGAGGDDAPLACDLKRHRRTWNVAMDNARTVPGYKYYVDATTGERRDWLVTFLNVVPDDGSRVNGVLFGVSPEALCDLDRRERNYERIEVSADLDRPVDGQAWVYAGTDAAVGRFELGLRTGRAVISNGYYQRVVEDFAAIGADQRQKFVELTDRPPCPVLDLKRIDLPPTLEPRDRAAASPGDYPAGGLGSALRG